MGKKAFTLVELIVTIVVLISLTTIAYLNLKKYPSKARNVKRLSDIKEIQKFLDVYYFNNQHYPKPDNSILENGWWKGEVGSGVLSKLENMSKTVDPGTKKPYSYDLLITGNAFKLQAKNAEKEYIGYGNYNTDGIFVNETTSNVFEIINNSWSDFDSNCKLPDIDIYNGSGELIQTWAGCNSTLGNGMEYSEGENCVYHEYESWHEDWVNHSCTDIGFTKSTDNPQDLIKDILGTNVNKNGDPEFDTIWGKLYDLSNAESACPKGWHVPTKDDFTKLLIALGCSDINYSIGQGSNGSSGFYGKCSGLGWKRTKPVKKTLQKNLAELLKVPLSGGVNQWKQSKGRGSSTSFWTSTKNNNPLLKDTNRYFFIGFWASYDFLLLGNYDVKSRLSVRCIKDNY